MNVPNNDDNNNNTTFGIWANGVVMSMVVDTSVNTITNVIFFF